MSVKSFSESAAQTSETLTAIGNAVECNGRFSEACFRVDSTGGSVIALDAFELQIQSDAGSGWETFISAWTADIVEQMPWQSGNLALLAHGGEDSAWVKLPPCHAIRFLSAQAGITASAVTVTVAGYLR